MRFAIVLLSLALAVSVRYLAILFAIFPLNEKGQMSRNINFRDLLFEIALGLRRQEVFLEACSILDTQWETLIARQKVIFQPFLI